MLIGCGSISRLHAERILRNPQCRLAALFDPVVPSAEALKKEMAPGAELFSDFDRLLKAVANRSSVAAVICSPTHLHFEQTAALRSVGVPVLCEKPLADSRRRIETLVADAASGPLLTVAYQRRTWSTFRTLRRIVAGQQFGPVRGITAHCPEQWSPGIVGTWRNDPAMNPGGFVGDAGSHKIDQLFFVTGLTPVEVFAHGSRRDRNVEIMVSVSARLSGPHADDVIASLNFVGDANHYREDFHVHCAEADLMIRDDRLWIGRGNRVEPLESAAALEPESDPIAAFTATLLGQAPNFAPPQCALPVWDFTQAILTSIGTGQPIRMT
jgi:predicted dehydrogenase